MERLTDGIMLEDGWIKPDSVSLLGPDQITLSIHEGRKRIVKRLVAALGYKVKELHRTRFCGLSSDDLPHGSWREISPEEINTLRESVGLEPIA
jgi:23S rRNA pseudouridine2605 synthase